MVVNAGQFAYIMMQRLETTKIRFYKPMLKYHGLKIWATNKSLIKRKRAFKIRMEPLAICEHNMRQERVYREFNTHKALKVGEDDCD